MKNEICGLKAGFYHSVDGSILCKICRSDNGVHIEFADFDANTFYAATIDENGAATFECGDITETRNDENRKDENGKD